MKTIEHTDKTAREYFVALFIDGRQVPSSSYFSGPHEKAVAVCRRMSARGDRHPSCYFRVVPCVGV